jgi:hypothetical protein
MWNSHGYLVHVFIHEENLWLKNLPASQIIAGKGTEVSMWDFPSNEIMDFLSGVS